MVVRLDRGLALLIASLPVMALCARDQTRQPRPCLLPAKRYGFNNELIEVFKFRSMYIDQTDATAAKLVTKNDLRVTRVGPFSAR
jgi:lipopolysaccharide/colanic/teichoic acid biosynthesis glycosyltransferase